MDGKEAQLQQMSGRRRSISGFNGLTTAIQIRIATKLDLSQAFQYIQDLVQKSSIKDQMVLFGEDEFPLMRVFDALIEEGDAITVADYSSGRLMAVITITPSHFKRTFYRAIADIRVINHPDLPIGPSFCDLINLGVEAAALLGYESVISEQFIFNQKLIDALEDLGFRLCGYIPSSARVRSGGPRLMASVPMYKEIIDRKKRKWCPPDKVVSEQWQTYTTRVYDLPTVKVSSMLPLVRTAPNGTVMEIDYVKEKHLDLVHGELSTILEAGIGLSVDEYVHTSLQGFKDEFLHPEDAGCVTLSATDAVTGELIALMIVEPHSSTRSCRPVLADWTIIVRQKYRQYEIRNTLLEVFLIVSKALGYKGALLDSMVTLVHLMCKSDGVIICTIPGTGYIQNHGWCNCLFIFVDFRCLPLANL